MDIQSEKIELMKQLLETESWEVINKIKAVFKSVDDDFYDDLPAHVKVDIQAASDEIERGDVYDHEFVMREFKEKYGSKHLMVPQGKKAISTSSGLFTRKLG